MKQLSLQKALRFFFLLALLAISTVTFTNQSSAPSGNTGAPSDGNCTGCHSGTAINSGTAHASITLSGLPAGGYAPGATYTLTFSAQSAATTKNGFQVTALSATNAMAGSFTAGTGNQSQIGSGRSYIGHTSAGTSQNQWTFNWTAPNPAVGNVTFYAALNATNSNNNTVGDMVYLKSFNVAPGNLPVATITSPANSAVFCVGDTVQFTGTATNNPTSFAWDFLGNSPNASAQQNPKIVMNSVGFRTVRFRASNSSGTSANAQITIQVVAKPTASISGKNILCGNDSITLTANSGTGFTYLWQPGNLTSQSIKVGSAGNYTVKVTNPGNCSVTSAPFAVISGGSKPQVSLTLSSDSLCSSDSVLLTASSGLDSYVFYRNGQPIDSIAQNQIWLKGFTANTILGVKAYSGVCASEVAEKLLSVQLKPAAPVLSCGPFTSNSISFNVLGANTEISADSGKTWLNPNQGNVHFISGLNPNTSVFLMARSVVGGACLYSMVSERTCAAASCAPIALEILAPKYVCENRAGGSYPMITLKVKAPGLTDPYYVFKTNVPPIFINMNSKLDSVNYQYSLSTGSKISFQVSVRDSANPFCPAKDTLVDIVFQSKPLVTVVKEKGAFCHGDSVSFRLTAGVNPSVLAATYYQDSILIGSNTKANGFLVGPKAVFPEFKDGANIYAVLTDTLGNCNHPTEPFTMLVKPLPTVGFTVSTFNLNVQLNDTSTFTSNRTWYMEGDSFPSNPRVFNYTFKNAGNNNIKMKGVSSFGCENVVEKTVQINATGLSSLSNEIGLEVYPNPSNGKITLEYSGVGVAQVSLFTIQGKLVYQSMHKSSDEIDLQVIKTGVYLLQVELQDKIAMQKIVIE
ncbi:MAG: choice-of-anchor V domain-containing protein [Bacteroidota bacterium]|nr:choice-of-anchor V domain-containing protein [Bacteroidota bacterium]